MDLNSSGIRKFTHEAYCNYSKCSVVIEVYKSSSRLQDTYMGRREPVRDESEFSSTYRKKWQVSTLALGYNRQWERWVRRLRVSV